jgi:hypothetical protein
LSSIIILSEIPLRLVLSPIRLTSPVITSPDLITVRKKFEVGSNTTKLLWYISSPSVVVLVIVSVSIFFYQSFINNRFNVHTLLGDYPSLDSGGLILIDSLTIGGGITNTSPFVGNIT